MMKSRKWAVALIGLAVFSLAMLPVFTTSQPAGAAGPGPTAGSYTYVVEGRETGFPFDPINRQNGLLVPSDVFENQGFKVVASGNQATVTRDGQTATVKLGDPNVNVFGNMEQVSPAPMWVADHLFLPAALAGRWGVDINLDGIYVFVHDNTKGQPPVTTLAEADYNNLLLGRQISNVNVRADNGQLLNVSLTTLNSAIVADASFTQDPNLRARVQALLPTNTLVLAEVKSFASRSGLFQANTIYLVDQFGQQYGFTGTVLPVAGQNVTGRIIPGTSMKSVLAFAKVSKDAATLSVWSDNNNGTLGSFTRAQ